MRRWASKLAAVALVASTLIFLLLVPSGKFSPSSTMLLAPEMSHTTTSNNTSTKEASSSALEMARRMNPTDSVPTESEVPREEAKGEDDDGTAEEEKEEGDGTAEGESPKALSSRFNFDPRLGFRDASIKFKSFAHVWTGSTFAALSTRHAATLATQVEHF